MTRAPLPNTLAPPGVPVREGLMMKGGREPAEPDAMPSDSRQARQIARRQLMAEAIMAEGAIRIEDIVERFGISLMTAHRDLDELASRGFLRKTRGVVSAAPTSLIEASDVYRASRQCAEKYAIAEAAARSSSPGRRSSSTIPRPCCNSFRISRRGCR